MKDDAFFKAVSSRARETFREFNQNLITNTRWAGTKMEINDCLSKAN